MADVMDELRFSIEEDGTVTVDTDERMRIAPGFRDRLARARGDALVMHPGPINRGVEMSSGVADGQNSVILEQVTNGIAVRMAVLYLVAHAKR